MDAALLPIVPLRVRPLADAAGWAAWLRDIDIPVQADTAAAIEAMRAHEDAVDANSLGELIATDPLMTLKLLVHACKHRPASVVTDPATVIGELVMMGIAPFFQVFGPQPCIEDRLPVATGTGTCTGLAGLFGDGNGDDHDGDDDDNGGALAGLRRVLNRARRAAAFALAFAVRRDDHHAAAIHQAALLHDFAELLLWCHAPLLAQRIAELQRVDPGLRSDTVQRVVLNAELPDIQRALTRAWHLPETLTRATADAGRLVAERPGGRTVALAVRLAGHTSRGWDDPAVPDDVSDIAQLLGLPADDTLGWLRDVDR